MNTLNIERKKAVVSALVEGMSINSVVRMTLVSKPTILKIINDLGRACDKHHDEHVRGLKPATIQTDEIWSFIGAKAKNLKAGQELEGWGDCWTWTAIHIGSLPDSNRLGSPLSAWVVAGLMFFNHFPRCDHRWISPPARHQLHAAALR